MNCYLCLVSVPVWIWRAIVSFCTCIYKPKTHFKAGLIDQMQSCHSRRGGYWTGSYRRTIDTRECFYTFLGSIDREADKEELQKFVSRLAQDMNTKGQVPARYDAHWFGREIPRYRSKISEEPIVDSNMFFIILLWAMYDRYQLSIGKYYIAAQRAYQFLDKYVAEDTFYEPTGASWETTREHTNNLLLTNVIMTKTIRCMELIAMVQKDHRLKTLCIERYAKFVKKIQPELYRTQEVLPRVLAIHWNIMPTNFLPSFNQEIETNTWIPLRTKGPVEMPRTTRSIIFGRSDMHAEIIWPFVGFLWIVILEEKCKHHLAKKWWVSYMDFHAPRTLHDMYEPLKGKPIRRAFLTSEACHVSTISLYLAAKRRIEEAMLNQDV